MTAASAESSDSTGKYKPVEDARGLYVVYSSESDKSKKLADTLGTLFSGNHVPLNHGGKVSTVQLGRSLAWIHKTVPPAVLIELGFLTNRDDSKLLSDSGYIKKLIVLVSDGLEQFATRIANG